MLQTVCFEGRIRKPKINVPVIFIARILSQPAGVQRQEESRKQNSKTYFSDERIHFQRSFSISGRPETFGSAGGAERSTFRRLSHPPGWNRARQNRMSSRLRTHRTSNKFGPPHLSKNVRISPIIILLMNGKTISVPKTTCRPGPRRRPNCRRPANRRRL